jgi:tRNA threonylcarbamoyladenosine biosynthesis protein TsaE
MAATVLHSERDTIDFGSFCADKIKSPGVFYLSGELGAGKTTWVKGFMQGLGYKGVLRSPTYPIIQRYEVGDKRVAHLDLYRLHGDDDFLDSGLADEFEATDYLLIEWPERVHSCLPNPSIDLRFHIGGDSHFVSLNEACFSALQLSEFLKD